jgi:hypothetical protein
MTKSEAELRLNSFPNGSTSLSPAQWPESPPPEQKKPGFFGRVGHSFLRICRVE